MGETQLAAVGRSDVIGLIVFGRPTIDTTLLSSSDTLKVSGNVHDWLIPGVQAWRLDETISLAHFDYNLSRASSRVGRT